MVEEMTGVIAGVTIVAVGVVAVLVAVAVFWYRKHRAGTKDAEPPQSHGIDNRGVEIP